MPVSYGFAISLLSVSTLNVTNALLKAYFKPTTLAGSDTCGYCNNFGYKCTIKIENADTTVDGEMVEYTRKEPESGVCMWYVLYS